MTLLQKQISTFTKRSIEWTGTLERILREFLTTAEIKLSEVEQDRLYSLPRSMMDLVQSGVLYGIELKAGGDGLRIEFSLDPDIEDELDLSMLRLCDLSAERLEIELLIRNPELARSLGAEMLTELSSEKVIVSLYSVEKSLAPFPPLDTNGHEQYSQDNEEH